ncbi:MAG: FCD domain-containing protein [Alphaproteobacteria bacterium]
MAVRKHAIGADDAEAGQIGGTLASTVCEQLRVDILTGTLPPGEKLRIESLRARYGAGTSPIREALSRLSANGFVVREDRKGFRVAQVSRTELSELIKTRCWLEETALRESIANGDAAWEEDIVLSFHRLSRVPRSASERRYVSNPEWERPHRSFHSSLIAACGSGLLIAFCEHLNDRADRYRQFANVIDYPKRNALAEHRDIMDAVLDREADRAVALLHAHYRLTAEIILESMPPLAPGDTDAA